MDPLARRMEAGDFDAWRPLWDAYNDFYRNELAEDVSRETFRRVHEGEVGFHGLVAQENEGLVGFAQAVFHPSRWNVGEYCYLEDLFVARARRGTRIAKRLVEAAYEEADRRGAERVYWHTDAYNAPADPSTTASAASGPTRSTRRSGPWGRRVTLAAGRGSRRGRCARTRPASPPRRRGR